MPEAESVETRRVGPFVLAEVLGRGGMGVVYVARDTRLDRRVALKLVAPEVASDPDFRRRFQREARAAAAVEHPNVLTVYEAGEAGGELYLATPLVEGTDLRALLERHGRLDPRRCGEVIAALGAGLDAAHAANLVHRDVKPANVLVRGAGDGGDIYLTDFGLTQSIDTQSRITQAGRVIGTPDYMAPEQIRGNRLDGRVDVYALACLAFECLTGSPPYARDSSNATLQAHLADPIPLASAARGVGHEVDEVLAAGLAKDPSRRFASCGALAHALGQALGTNTGVIPANPRVAADARPDRDRPPVRPRAEPPPDGRGTASRGWGVAAVVAIAAVAAGVTAAVLGGGGADGDDARPLLVPARAVHENLSALVDRGEEEGYDSAELSIQRDRAAVLEAESRELVAAAEDVEEAIDADLLAALETQDRLVADYAAGLEGAPPTDGDLARLDRALARLEPELRGR
jgi:hypothetical protein